MKQHRFIKHATANRKPRRFIAFSGGVESSTMCLLYGKGATAIWCDTGAENKEMYERIDYCEQRFKEIHNGDFELLRLRASVKVKGEYVDNLTDAIKGWMFMPSVFERWCTGKFKIIPIDEFLSKQGNCELMIGFNANEEPGKDRTGNLMKCQNVTYTYPLYHAGLDREDCEDLLEANGLLPNFPIYMQRGGCYYCIFKTLPELKAYYFFDRETFDKMKALELEVQDKRKKFFCLSATQRSMSEIQAECEREISMWGMDAINKMYNRGIRTGQACGALCHR